MNAILKSLGNTVEGQITCKDRLGRQAVTIRTRAEVMKAFGVVVCFRLNETFHYIIYLASCLTEMHSANERARAAVQMCVAVLLFS